MYCHNSDDPGVMTIRCGPNEKIRMLDAFDATAKHKSRLPIQCLKQKQHLKEANQDTDGVDCKVHTSFTSACSGRENCTLHMQRIRLNSPQDNCHNQLVDYTMAFFECISSTLNIERQDHMKHGLVKRYSKARSNCKQKLLNRKKIKRSDKRAIKRK